jgi:hypothetical protein
MVSDFMDIRGKHGGGRGILKKNSGNMLILNRNVRDLFQCGTQWHG